ncbi:GLPGLI family protein [Lutibacter holmesii]|uniref:GLPGLI family protein n=1 Tax=Lutibacter holmesii TaxID=1137985 RepID=A0ABW3WQU5_9FLAO
MKNYLLKISTLILLLFTISLNAQDFQGKATYFSKTTLDIDFSASGIPADRVKMMKERMKSNLEKTYQFTFNKTASLYKQEAQLNQASGPGGGRGGMRMMMMGGGASGNYYKNIQTKKSTKENEFSGKNFLVKDDLVTYNWQMEQETKMIGNYLCFKATTTIERQARPEMKFGRRSPEEREAEEKKAKELENVMEVITVTAWYTLDIPVSNGPGDYWGLPGLILEVDAGETKILCTKIVLNPKEQVTISEPTKGKEVTQKEYDTIVEEKTKEMRERFQNERQKSGRGGFRG